MVSKGSKISFNWFFRHPYLFGALVFLLVFSLSVLVTKKDFFIYQDKQQEELKAILYDIEENIDQMLKSSYVSTLSLAMTINDEGEPKDFETVAKKLLESNATIDAVELVRNGTITEVYPYDSNKEAIGLNILEYPPTKKEALKAIETGKMYFAGPLELQQGGVGVVGRLPVYKGDEFWGFSVVIIGWEKLLQYSRISYYNKGDIHFLFRKKNPFTEKYENFVQSDEEFDMENAEKIYIDDADWEIFIAPKNKFSSYYSIIPFLVFGLLIASACAFIAVSILRRPQELQKLVSAQASDIFSKELKFKAIFDNAGIGIAQVDVGKDSLITVNSKLIEKSGFSSEELKGMKFCDLIETKAKKNTLIKNDNDKFSGKLITKNGEKRLVHIINTLYHDNEIGETIISLIEDITEKKKSERQIKELQQKMKMAIRISKLAYWEWWPKTDKIIWSDKMYDIFGCDEDIQLSSDYILSKKHHNDLRVYKEQISKLLEKSSSVTFECRFYDNEGETVHTLINAESFADNHGNVVKIMGSLLDITDKKQAEIDLRQSYDLVLEQNERLVNFSYIVSHNLRSHSSNMQSIVELIKSSDDKQEIEELFEVLSNVTHSLNSTLEDLNEIIHIQKKENTAIIEELNLYEFVNRALQTLEQNILHKNAKIVIEVPKDEKIRFNAAYLESVLLNIISNSIKYAKPEIPPEIEIEFSENDDYKILKIKDNGIGIDMNSNKDNIFGMYQTFSDYKNARGIGLFVSKNQMEAMNGKIDLESELHKGTVFKLYFEKNENLHH